MEFPRMGKRFLPQSYCRSRERLRCVFDTGKGALPILGDLVKAKRGRASFRAVGQEAGILGTVVQDVELHYGAKIEEIEALLRWVGKTAEQVQLPTVIVHRIIGRPKPGNETDNAIAAAILDWIAEGNVLEKFESQKLSVDGRYAKKFVIRMMKNNTEFRTQYEQARAIGANFMADDIISIADNPRIDPKQAKNMIDARKWNAAKHNPGKFGDNSTSDVNVNVGFVDALKQLEGRRNREIAAPRELKVIDVQPLELSQDVNVADNPDAVRVVD